MRENRTSGSEGGVESILHSYPYQQRQLGQSPRCFNCTRFRGGLLDSQALA